MNRALRSSPVLPFALASVAMLSLACGGSDGTADAGPSEDARVNRDAFTLPDASTADAEPATDVAGRDGGHFCVVNGSITVSGTAVPVGSAMAAPTNPSGASATVNSCIDRRPTQVIAAPIRYRGCLGFIGAPGTLAEVQQALFTVFRSDNMGSPTDPSFDPVTGMDRTPSTRLAARPVVTPVGRAVCASGFQLEFGRNEVGMGAIVSDLPHTIRVRSSSTAPNQLWATSYFFNVNVRSDSLEQGSRPADQCTPQTCSGRVDLVLIRRSALQDMITASGVGVPGSMNLGDNQGAGYGLLLANDCQDIPMSHAAGGFAPMPLATSYLTTNFGWNRNATDTSSVGALMALGFANTATSGPTTARAAVTVNRNGVCSERFAGSTFFVYPDAVSVIKSGRENTVN